VHTGPNPPYQWTDPQVRVDLSTLRETASGLIARHTEFWNKTETEMAA
jgi:hypothetical protein